MTRSRRNGLTIGELVIASGLLAMMVVTVMVLFGQMLDATSKNALVSQGSFFAETVIEREVYNLARTGQASNFYNQDWISFTDVANKTEFTYHIESRLASVPANTDMGNCYAIQVEVRWWQQAETQAQNRHGMGKMSLKRARIVYVPKP